MPPRLVIFDFDGTLADSLPWLSLAYADLAAQFGLNRPDDAAAEALRGMDTAAVLRALGVARWRLPAIAARLRAMAAEAPPPPLFPGIAALLPRLAGAGLRIGIASSNSEPQIRRTLGAELAGLVGCYAAEASLFGKAARFRRILRATRVPTAATIAIGDEPRDVAAAREAGVIAGAVAWGYATPASLRSTTPDVFFETVEEIARYCGA